MNTPDCMEYYFYSQSVHEYAWSYKNFAKKNTPKNNMHMQSTTKTHRKNIFM